MGQKGRPCGGCHPFAELTRHVVPRRSKSRTRTACRHDPGDVDEGSYGRRGARCAGGTTATDAGTYALCSTTRLSGAEPAKMLKGRGGRAGMPRWEGPKALVQRSCKDVGLKSYQVCGLTGRGHFSTTGRELSVRLAPYWSCGLLIDIGASRCPLPDDRTVAAGPGRIED